MQPEVLPKAGCASCRIVMISFGGTASTNGTRAELRAPLGEPIIQPTIAEPAAQCRRNKRLRGLSLRPTQAVPEQEFQIAPFSAPTGQKVARFSTIKIRARFYVLCAGERAAFSLL